jgi:hypothetical protein
MLHRRAFASRVTAGGSTTSEPVRAAGLPTWRSRALDVLRRDRTSYWVLALALAVYAALNLWLTRGATLFVDEVQIFLGDHGFNPDTLLSPLNGHLIAVERAFHETTYELFGADFLVLRLAMTLGALLAAAAFFVLQKERIGLPAALAPTVLILFLGTSWETNLIISGITNTYSIAAGLGALLAIERGTIRGDIVACVLLVVSIASWSLGVAFAIGIGVLVLLQPHRRGRLFVFLLPLGLYVAWLIWVEAIHTPAQGIAPAVALENLAAMPNFVADQLAATAGAIAGLNYPFGSPDESRLFTTKAIFGPLLAALAAVALLVRFRRGGVPAMIWALAATLLVFSAALAVNESRTPETARYVYPAAVIVLLIGAEAARGIRLSNTALAAIFIVAAVGLGANLLRMVDGAAFFRSYSASLRAELSAVELARDYVDPAFIAFPDGIGPARAGPYLAAVDRIGSPAFSPSELTEQSEELRARADAALVRAGAVAVTPLDRDRSDRNCLRHDGSAVVDIRPPGAVISAEGEAELSVRRFADATTTPLGPPLSDGSPGEVRIRDDESTQPWLVSIVADGATRICRLEAP